MKYLVTSSISNPKVCYVPNCRTRLNMHTSWTLSLLKRLAKVCLQSPRQLHRTPLAVKCGQWWLTILQPWQKCETALTTMTKTSSLLNMLEKVIYTLHLVITYVFYPKKKTDSGDPETLDRDLLLLLHIFISFYFFNIYIG